MIIPIASAVLPTTGIRSFMFQRTDTHKHRGIDLPSPAGTPVRAAATGVVRYATHVWQQGFTGYGRVVVLEHKELGVWTLYAHLQDVLVNQGETVAAGTQIGTVGRTEFGADNHEGLFPEGGEHLHFEVSPRPYPQDAEAARMDPVAWLEGRNAAPVDLAYRQLIDSSTAAEFFVFAGALLAAAWFYKKRKGKDEEG